MDRSGHYEQAAHVPLSFSFEEQSPHHAHVYDVIQRRRAVQSTDHTSLSTLLVLMNTAQNAAIGV